MDATAAPLASKPRHWQQHLERQEREREARRLSRENRLAAEPHKICAGCGLSLPLGAYSPKGPGKFNSRCRPCHSAKQAARKRAKQAAWTDEQRDRHRAADRAAWYARQGRSGEIGRSLEDRAKDREARRAIQAASRAARLAEAEQRREAERAEADAARLAAKAARAAQTQAQRALAEAQDVARRQVELEAQKHDATALDVELALACAAAVEAQEKAQALAVIAAARAAAERRRQAPYVHPTLAQRLAHLWPPERPRTVILRNASPIPIGELARRHFWREQGLRFRRFEGHWR